MNLDPSPQPLTAWLHRVVWVDRHEAHGLEAGHRGVRLGLLLVVHGDGALVVRAVYIHLGDAR